MNTTQLSRWSPSISNMSAGHRSATFFRSCCVGILLALSQAAHAISPIPFYEPFPLTYAENGNLGAGESLLKWDFGNSATSSSARTIALAALGYPGLLTEDIANSRGLQSRPAGAGAKDRGATLELPPGVDVYASFLLNVQTTNVVTSRFFGLSPSGGSGSSVNANGALIFLDTQRHLMIAKNSTTPAAAIPFSLVTNNTYLVVLRYKYNAGSTTNDSVDLWVNPTSLGNNASIPAPTLSTTANNDVAAFNSVAYFQNNAVANAGIGSYWIDEIRVSTNWADVTPTTCSAGAVFNVTGGGSICAGAGFPVGLSGSEVNVDYWLHTNGVYSATIPGTGAAVSFGNQDANAIYTVLASNTVSGCVSWMSGNATVALLAAPSIDTEPAAITVASGGAGTLSLAASGDGLTYQWRKNGVNLSNGGHYSGVNTPTLTIYPVDGSDAATALNGYDVVVSGTCAPAATSTRVGLTVKAVSNLVWSGDGAENLWDVATTPNWLEAGNPVTFNFGDNVIFDDTSANLAVQLASPFLSPGKITVDTVQEYIFRPGGSISGPGTTLLKTGTGTLYLTNNVNSYGGGTTISNGAIAINSGQALGTGVVTLAGGNLDSGNALVTVANPVVVTADSTILIRNTSGSALRLENNLTGVDGTLTIFNTTVSGPAVQLAYTNIVFNRPLVVDNSGGTFLILSSANTSGTQTFNNVISGTGRLARNGNGGTTLLNAANTYSGGTTLQNGTVGIGADSLSTSFPTVDSGALGTGTISVDSGATSTLFASGGARSVDNPILFTGAIAGSPLVFSGSHNLTFNGTVDLGAAVRTLQVENPVRATLNGDIFNGGINKTGSGVLHLNGLNIFVDQITASGGTLGGTGVISAPVTIASGAVLAPGDPIGTMTINSDLTLNGNLLIEVDRSASVSNDTVQVAGTLSNGGTGTLTVVNVGAGLSVGDKFTIFNQPVLNGETMTVSGGGATWVNDLALDGSITVASVVPSQPTLNFSRVGNSLQFSWTGSFKLQSQTNSLAVGLSNNWGDYPGGSTSGISVPINSAHGAVFFRLIPAP
ncbi:MAG TPA: autotransporter-associated beta strand repeat-containing protein [Verrucomicrobiae bacterium]|nr:autotransporter-associated beta strand repeat-containing protein [Verrucomicrobiae bacterium]